MKPSEIVTHLRNYCPLFERRIAAGINWEAVRDDTQMRAMAAYVVPTDEKASDPLYENVLVQELTEGIDVVVVFPQQQESGAGVANQVSAVRHALCRALVGWKPPGSSAPLIYEGRSFLHTDRIKAAYAFSFSALEILGNAVLPSDPAAAETWAELELLGLTPLEGIDIDVDLIDPAVDKSIKPDGVGPDGRTEHQLKKDFPHD